MLIEAYEGFEWHLATFAALLVLQAYVFRKDTIANTYGLFSNPHFCLAMSYFLVILTITDTLKG